MISRSLPSVDVPPRFHALRDRSFDRISVTRGPLAMELRDRADVDGRAFHDDVHSQDRARPSAPVTSTASAEVGRVIDVAGIRAPAANRDGFRFHDPNVAAPMGERQV